MKKIVLLPLLLLVGFASLAQPKPAPKPAVKTITKPAPKPTIVLKNLQDSVSYVMGLSVANYYSQMADYYKQMGVKNINTTLVSKAFTEIIGGKKPLIEDNAANTLVNNYINRLMEDKAKDNIEAGKKFLAENQKRPEVKTTASGLQYEVITEGTGIRPTALDTFVCHYRGTLLNGTEFDASYNRGQPLEMPVGGVIPGWIEGLQLMTVGSKYKFYIPYNLGYGTRENGAIPAGSTLIFEVELLNVKKNGN